VAVQKYIDLKNRIVELGYQLKEAQHLANVSALEEMGNPSYEVTSVVFQQQADRIKAQIDDLSKELPCDEFIKRFGYDLHELYREKYSINKDTVVVKSFIDYGAFGEFHYALPDHEMMVYRVGDDIPASVPSQRYGKTKVERWGDSASRRFTLAWAPEINTVFFWD
jgi:hypothetical protein